ncbi:MAG: UDP-glucose--hexose-1-phosphate uridylyltransferase [Bacteroidales bacterium]|nr:UDP-glucose--hexose-1-phosphate uridylyltransferase [Clostridium sp.]MCM1204805.1 UDP-glucose--hexose-1-phosphate uridylyltransferase [Bacteroidales bacterium]
MIDNLICELVNYGLQNGLVDTADAVYVTNQLLSLFQRLDYHPAVPQPPKPRRLHLILEDMLVYAWENGILEEDTVTMKDLFDTRIMGLLTPPPSVVRKTFKEKYAISPKAATDYYYRFSQAANYIRTDRIAMDEKWTADTEFGALDITINLSKPEKDPRDIAKAGQAKKSGYPSCLLCKENEGYAGHFSHPARQNHRIIPLTLCNEAYNLQYSPYVYYNEHCIIFNDNHIPMKIGRGAFEKLLDFVRQFPHYTAGSNADLPIVGGSILSHDHFQGGSYPFAMADAPYEWEFTLKDYPDIHARTVKWPMSVIRLQGKNAAAVASAANHILSAWRSYTDENAYIFSETNGTPHNTITPIARMRDNLYELDLVLRNNITTEECPWGVYHPHARYHHIKKENIGLIEVMGLAVLPARLKEELAQLEDAILSHKDIRQNPVIKKHADWTEEWIANYTITAENIHEILQKEVGNVFIKALECAGVYKRTPEGRAAFEKFINAL